MSELTWIRSHVERCLQDVWDVCQLTVDADGDYPFRRGTAACWVRVVPDDQVAVRVFAHAATGVRRTAKLLAELNEIQAEALSASVFWSDGTVMVQQTLSPYGLTRASLLQATRAVSGLAEHVGVLVAGLYGGSTPFPALEGVDEEVT